MAYRGITAPLPIGRQGFNGSKNPSQLQPGHMSAVNGVQLEAGLIEKEGGAAKLNSTALASGLKVLAGTSITHANGNVHDVVFLADGSVRHDDGTGSFGTTMVSGLTATEDPPPVFVHAGGEDVGDSTKLLLFSADNQVQAADDHTASSMSAITTPPSDWASGQFPTFGLIHEGRLWGGGNQSDPHRIYYSTTTDHEDFSAANGGGTLPIFPGEGKALVGGFSFRRLLILWKFPVGVYYVDTRDPSPSNWVVGRLSTAVGGVNQNSIVQIANDIIYLDHGGNFHLMTATDEFGDINTSNLSNIADLGPFMRSNVNLEFLRRACGVWYAAKQQAWFAVPQLGNDENDLRIMIDFNDQQIGPRFLLSTRDTVTAMWTRQDDDDVSRPVTGDDAGFVWLMDQEARNKDGVAYEMRFETANIDFGFLDPQLKTRAKNGQFLEIVSESVGDWNLSVDVFWDDVYTQTITFHMGAGGEVIGSFELDTDTLGSTAVFSNRQRMIGAGRRLRFIVENDGLNQNIAVSEFHVGFSLADERSGNAPS